MCLFGSSVNVYLTFISYLNVFIYFFFFFSFWIYQQAVEDLLEDEDEDFDKDDKVIMFHVWDTQTHNSLRRGRHGFADQKHKQTNEMTPSSPPPLLILTA